jgi:acyl carrier protein
MSQTTEQEIYAIIGKHCGEDAGPVVATSNLTDLGIDSLEAIEIIFDIEEHFDVTLPDRDPNFDTGSVQGLVNAVESALAAKAAGAQAPVLATSDPSH